MVAGRIARRGIYDRIGNRGERVTTSLLLGSRLGVFSNALHRAQRLLNAAALKRQPTSREIPSRLLSLGTVTALGIQRNRRRDCDRSRRQDRRPRVIRIDPRTVVDTIRRRAEPVKRQAVVHVSPNSANPYA